MARITTINNETNTVKEKKEEIDNIMRSPECIDTGILQLNVKISLRTYLNGNEKIEYSYEPMTFLKNNIIMYH